MGVVSQCRETRLGKLGRHRQDTEGVGCEPPTCRRITLLPAAHPLDFEIGLRPRGQLYGIGLSGRKAVRLHRKAIRSRPEYRRWLRHSRKSSALLPKHCPSASLPAAGTNPAPFTAPAPGSALARPPQLAAARDWRALRSTGQAMRTLRDDACTWSLSDRLWSTAVAV